MTYSAVSTTTVLGTTERPSTIDLAEPGPRTTDSDIAMTLDAVASELRSLWSSALERGDFRESTRLVEASHAVHRAVIALTAEGFIAASSPSMPG